MAASRKKVFFIINLVQDVAIVRGLAFLTARETEAEIAFLVTQAFIKRDRQRIWQSEVASMATAVGAAMYLYGDTAEALAVLEGGAGLIFAAAESNLMAHREVSDVFLRASASYLKITLQHGFECIGFRQSREHVISHGRNISFAADVVCGWFEPSALTSLTASQRAKLYVTGPPTLLQQTRRSADRDMPKTGLVCENMHSVRLRASGDHKASFMDIFFAFCREMANRNDSVTLRPHPGGQYVLKNNVALPENVQLDSRPIYDLDLRGFRFGISAPSTIVFDMVLAGIPVGLWRDPAGIMDASNYEGLREISGLDDWLAFERDVRERPGVILADQQAFLDRLPMPIDRSEIYRRFARLIVAGLSAMKVIERKTGNAGPSRPMQLSGDSLVEVAA
jgi:hypothetical protein